MTTTPAEPDRRKRMAELVAIMCETWQREGSELTIEAYWRALADLPMDAIEAAAQSAMRSERFMPPPAMLRQLAGHGKSEDLAEIAWESVVAAIRRHGAYASVHFEDRAAASAIRGLGGWRRLCDTETGELHSFSRNAFLKAYRSWRDTGAAVEVSGHLAGILEQDPDGIPAHRMIPAPYLPAGERAPIALPDRATGTDGRVRRLTDGIGRPKR